MCCTEFGMLISVNDVQFQNAKSFITLSELPRTILLKFVHPLKVELSSVVIEFGKTILVIALYPEKASLLICFTGSPSYVAGITISVSVHSPIPVTV